MSGSRLWFGVGDSMPRRIAYSMGRVLARQLENRRRSGPLRGPLLRPSRCDWSISRRLGTASRHDQEDAVEGLFAKVPEDATFSPTKRRYPVIAIKLPYRTSPSPTAACERWPPRPTPGGGARSPALRPQPPAGCGAARRGLRPLRPLHRQPGLGLLASVQPMYDRTPVGGARRGQGRRPPERNRRRREWRSSPTSGGPHRRRSESIEVMANHGFHGPMEGDVCSRVGAYPAPLERRSPVRVP